MSHRLIPLLCVLGLSQPALAFDISFDWTGLELCTSGTPNLVDNPFFSLQEVPSDTRFIRFQLTDLDVPQYNHGGGTVAFNGEGAVIPGQFQYKSPCPPDGPHTYQWRATALSSKTGGELATALSSRRYPD